MRGIIYAMKFANGSTYVGATTNFPSRRHNHRRSLRKGSAINARVREAYAKSGPPVFEPVAFCLDVTYIVEVETAVIDSLKPDLNVNLKPNKFVFGSSKKAEKVAKPKRIISIQGVEHTLDEASEKFNVAKHLITQRLCNKWTPEEAVGLQTRPFEQRVASRKVVEEQRRKSKLFTHDGVTMRFCPLCAHFKVTASTVKRQMDMGASLAEAIEYAKNYRYKNLTEEGRRLFRK